jgi:hypothetical protein
MFELFSDMYFIVYKLYYIGQNDNLGIRVSLRNWDGGSILRWHINLMLPTFTTQHNVIFKLNKPRQWKSQLRIPSLVTTDIVDDTVHGRGNLYGSVWSMGGLDGTQCHLAWRKWAIGVLISSMGYWDGTGSSASGEGEERQTKEGWS